MTPTIVAVVLAVMFVAAFVRSALGFGEAVIGMPLLVLVVGLPVATPLLGLAGFAMSSTILVRSWRQVDVKSVWRLIVSALAGIPIGLFFLTKAPEAITERVLGIVLIGFGLYNLAAPKMPELQDERLAFIFGFVGGVLGGAYNTSGPTAVVYGALRHWPPQRFRATLQGYFLPTGLAILIGQGAAGLWTPDVLRLFAYTLPVLLLSAYLGGKANRRLSGGQFRRVIYGVLVLMGALLLV
ncbi:MAG TPA: sulfite exporter TauE/SafE family protein [Anaerolineae bacterium]|nr:sulfite exporter TauE/SafE family protein [Anaerolineae bacterium]